MARGFQGRTTSWLAVGVVVLGFLLGSLGLVLGPTWWLFWVGVVVALIGAGFAKAVGVMEDYEADEHERGETDQQAGR
jgi:nitrate/nitrite transporter NarK